jgi:2,3-bisphosphoglycerate-independent phosphoglycerate mutase
MADYNNKVLLLILDGWGLSTIDYGNAPFLANTPTLDYIYSTYPKTSLMASGLEVGLSPGEAGNSEIGHLNIGTGRVVWEDLPRITHAISSGEFFENPALVQALDNASNHNSSLHLIGLVSDGGVHSHISHLLAILKAASDRHIDQVYLHFISDGRDTLPKQAETFINEVEQAFAQLRVGKIATIVGRLFAMDRDNNLDRTDRAFSLFVNNVGQSFSTATQAILSAYQYDKNDETMEPAIIGQGATITDNDSVIFFNFRNDRMRQLSDMFLSSNNIERVPKNLFITTMTQYSLNQTAPTLFAPISLVNPLAAVIANTNLSQLHIAETDKYPHITYYFNGRSEQVFPNERDFMIPTKQVDSFDLYPLMSAPEISNAVVAGVNAGFDFIVANFANGDAVGHTGTLPAAIKACEGVDALLQKILAAASAAGYRVLLTADHGNCESMIDELTKEANKNHTINPVPFVYFDFVTKPFDFKPTVFSKEDFFQYASGTPIGVLADIAPSVLANLNLPQPEDMSGMDLTVAMR